MIDVGVILKRFETPDETRELDLGKYEVVNLGGMSIGRATYLPACRSGSLRGGDCGV